MEILRIRPEKCLSEKVCVQTMLQDDRGEQPGGPWAKPPPQFCEPGIPSLLSWLSSLLSFTRICLPCKWETTGHCLPLLQWKHQQLSRKQQMVVSPHRNPTMRWCSAETSSNWSSFPWAESRWLNLLLVCILNLRILTRYLGAGLFSLEGEGCNFHFFPLQQSLLLGKSLPRGLKHR